MMIREFTAEIRFFLCCFVDVPMQGNGSGLEHKSVPMWVLVRTGEINTSPGHEYVIGLNRSSEIRPTVSKPLYGLAVDSKHDLALIGSSLPQSLRRKVLKLCGTESFIERVVPCKVEHGYTYLYGAALVRLDDVRNLAFSVQEGFGLFLHQGNLEALAAVNKKKEVAWRNFSSLNVKEQAKDLKRFSKSGKKNSGNMPIIEIDMAGVQVKEGKLNAKIQIHDGDLAFVRHCMETWRIASEKDRAARWKKFMNTVVG